jgi:hypothetical protein
METISFYSLLPEDLKREAERKVTKEKMKKVMTELEDATFYVRLSRNFSGDEHIHVSVSLYGNVNWFYDRNSRKSCTTSKRKEILQKAKNIFSVDFQRIFTMLESNQIIAKKLKLKKEEQMIQAILTELYKVTNKNDV